LNKLAQISNFSKFHFTRIFQSIIGEETPFHLILRLRLEKAASLLIHGNDSISDIDYKDGYCCLPHKKGKAKESEISFESTDMKQPS